MGVKVSTPCSLPVAPTVVNEKVVTANIWGASCMLEGGVVGSMRALGRNCCH